MVRGNDLNNDTAPTNVGTRMYEIIPGGEARLPAKVICFDAATARTCGGMWTDVSNLPGSGWVYSIKQDPYRPDCLYVVTHDSGIFPLSATTGMRGCKASQPSETVSFTGLTADWITDGRQGPQRTEDFYAEDPAPLLRREFTVGPGLRAARQVQEDDRIEILTFAGGG